MTASFSLRRSYRHELRHNEIILHSPENFSMNSKLIRYGIMIIVPVFALVVFTANFSVDLFPKQRLNAARQKWIAQHLASYQMQVRTAIGLGWSFGPFPRGDFQVTVKDGKVTEAGERNWMTGVTDPNAPYQPVDSLSKVSVLTMDQIFDYTQDQLAPLSDINVYSCGKDRIEVDLDTTQNYIHSLQATCAGGWLGCAVSECGAALVVQNLKALNP
jgi:hypothetical protein